MKKFLVIVSIICLIFSFPTVSFAASTWTPSVHTHVGPFDLANDEVIACFHFKDFNGTIEYTIWNLNGAPEGTTLEVVQSFEGMPANIPSGWKIVSTRPYGIISPNGVAGMALLATICKQPTSTQGPSYTDPNFQVWSTNPSAKLVNGDFNGDGKTDKALVGGTSWNTIPVAFSNGDGSFRVTNLVNDNFATWATNSTAKVVCGDFNGDGKSDIALVGGTAWNTIPVAFSNGDGSFRVTNVPNANFALWATNPTARAVCSDFNGDGKSDIALVEGTGWTTMPLAYSNGDGSFIVTNNSK